MKNIDQGLFKELIATALCIFLKDIAFGLWMSVSLVCLAIVLAVLREVWRGVLNAVCFASCLPFCP